MIAVDSSTFIAFFSGDTGRDTEILEEALDTSAVMMVPTVLCELVSDTKLPSKIERSLLDLPQVSLLDGYWLRAGWLRRNILKRKRRARLADTLIAQACIDSNISLLTRDSDFSSYQKYAELKLVI